MYNFVISFHFPSILIKFSFIRYLYLNIFDIFMGYHSIHHLHLEFVGFPSILYFVNSMIIDFILKLEIKWNINTQIYFIYWMFESTMIRWKKRSIKLFHAECNPLLTGTRIIVIALTFFWFCLNWTWKLSVNNQMVELNSNVKVILHSLNKLSIVYMKMSSLSILLFLNVANICIHDFCSMKQIIQQMEISDWGI